MRSEEHVGGGSDGREGGHRVGAGRVTRSTFLCSLGRGGLNGGLVGGVDGNPVALDGSDGELRDTGGTLVRSSLEVPEETEDLLFSTGLREL
jgi:hypothetical protein